MQEFIKLASLLAEESGKIAKKYYRAPFDIESKDDASPVTIADKSIEKRLREIIEDQRPDDGIIGEEFGRKDSANGLNWVLDPIDGTKSFVIGRPTFGTLIALWEEDTPLLGIIDQPITQERWLGAKGAETTFNGVPVKTRPCPSLSAACAASTTPDMFKGGFDHVYKAFEEQSKMMAWGADCYAYGLLASGYMDAVVEMRLSTYDYAALVPVVEGAGGQITDWQGNALTLESKGDVIALGDAALWEEVKILLTSGS